MKKNISSREAPANLLEQRGADHKLLLNDMSSTTVLFLTTAIASLSLFGYISSGAIESVCRLPARQTTCDYVSWDLWDFRLQRRLLLRPYSAERTGRLRHHLSLAAGDSDFFPVLS